MGLSTKGLGAEKPRPQPGKGPMSSAVRALLAALKSGNEAQAEQALRAALVLADEESDDAGP